VLKVKGWPTGPADPLEEELEANLDKSAVSVGFEGRSITKPVIS